MNYRSLAGNVLTAFVSQGVSFLASFIMSIFVPKILGVEDFGYWQLFLFYTSYSGLFHFGLNDGVYLIQGGKKREEIDKSSISSQFISLILMEATVGIAIIVFGLIILDAGERQFVIFAFSIYTIILNVSTFLGYLFQALNETKKFSFMIMLDRIAFLIPMLILIALRNTSFEGYVWSYVAARICALAYALWMARDLISFKRSPSKIAASEAFNSIRVGFSLMIANIASTMVLGVARGLVDFAWGIEAFGQVSFSLSLVNFFISFVSQASMVLFPALRQGTETERRSFYHVIRESMELIFPFVYILYFPMRFLISAWLPQYSDSLIYFAVLLPVCVFNTKMDICGTTYFKVLREERTLLLLNLLTVFISASLSLFSIYCFESLTGVLLGAVIAVIVRSLWTEYHLNSRLQVPGTPMILEEVALTVSFIVLALLLPDEFTLVIYSMLYVIYLIKNRDAMSLLLRKVRNKVSINCKIS